MQFFTRIFTLAVAAAPLLSQAAPLTPRQSGGKYIVQLKPSIDIASIAVHHNNVREIHARNLAGRQDGGAPEGIDRKFDFGEFKGYSGSFDAATVEELKSLPEVLLVEEDYIMTTSTLITQSNSTWGLGSISSRTEGATSYIYDSTAGQGTYSYVIDSGIRITHSDFGDRATWGFNAVNDLDTDNLGHGTHVAGTIGGTTYGVAKRTNLIAVKVLEGNEGSTSDVISGLEWTINDIVTKNRQDSAVINISLGGPGAEVWDAAITSAWNAGVLIVVAAGNDGQLASTKSPGRSPEALTVGNIQQNGARNPFSNFGDAVDIWAAGTDVVSAYYSSDSATATLTGTSMASPHVAGLVSYVRGLEGLSSASAVKARLVELATLNRVTDTQGAANLLAYNGNGR
ncbi:subtilisin-like protease-like protein [Dothidotthia symphoricarpi CBS 119687]|uniref:Subtilisin-like protease-like protein n=1 Tax=Dothidotthia symphoricarpi CBS 119687 TaxID=1392245 RepID=A0A6A5ZXM8_9PLEO|nr:subtilisin-like protease-like protein [Dothidotthia symphoricarpi CBS 119687]KAF2123527.1 subtilisin-like protease-like protein [Dothidotthia symphoricarpi CBS 119687]